MTRFLPLFLCLFMLTLSPFISWGQTVITQENFEKSSTLPNAWRNQSQSPNVWMLNSEYESRIGASTPLQPKEITGAPQSRYLHIGNEKGKELNANYDITAPVISEVTTSRMNTIGYTDVQLSFWLLCEGQKGGDYGTIQVSINNGAFQPLLENIIGVGQWQKIVLPRRTGLLDNASLQFKFIWRNDADGVGTPPSFSIDELILTGNPMKEGIVINESTTRSYCAGMDFKIAYQGYNDFGLGNVFIAQLSDAKGNFDNPIDIGKFESQLRQGTIFCNVAQDFPEGTYQLRIISTNPKAVSVNTIPITITAPPLAGSVSAMATEVCAGSSALLTLNDFRGLITWEYSTDGFVFTPMPGSDLSVIASDPLMTSTWFRAKVSNGTCPPVFSNIVKINVSEPLFSGFPELEPGQFCAPTIVKLKLVDYTPGALIQWESSNDLIEWTDVIGATTDNFVTNPLEVTTYFRAGVYSDVCESRQYTFTVTATFGISVMCFQEPRVPLPNETVRIFVNTFNPDNTSATIFFDPGDGNSPKEFTDVKAFPFIIEHVYTEPITTSYNIVVKNGQGCVGSCQGVMTVLNQSINIQRGSNIPVFLCPGQTGTLYYESRGAFDKGNQFMVELSDAIGSFDNALNITAEASADSAVYRIPTEGLPFSNQYKMRVRSTLPVAYSDEITGINVFPVIETGIVGVSQELLCSPDAVTLAIKGQDPTVSLIWEYSEDGIDFQTIDKSLGATVWNTEKLDKNTWFRAKLERIGFGSCDPTYSDTLTVKVGMPVTCTFQPNPAAVGQATIFNVNIENDPGPFLMDVQFGDGKTATFENISTIPFTFQHTYETAGTFGYSVIIKGRICVGSCTQTITVEKPSFTVELVSINPKKLAFCGGETMSISAKASAPLSRSGKYIVELSDADGKFDNPTVLATQSISDSIFNADITLPNDLPAGTGYRIRVRTEAPNATSAVSSAAYSINPAPAKPEIELTTDKNTLRVKNGGAGTYRWYLQGSNTPITTGAAFTPTASGTYKVTLTNAAGCTAESEFIKFILVGIAEKKVSETGLRVYPNPVKSDLTIQMTVTAPFADLGLYNMMGQKVASRRVYTKDSRIDEDFDLSEQPSGIYFIKVVAGGKEQVAKIVKQ